MTEGAGQDSMTAGAPLAGAQAAKAQARRAEQPGAGVPEHGTEPTAASVWYAVSGGLITDRLLEWPADVFALTNVVLNRAEAFRYAVAAYDWPPGPFGEWPDAVASAARAWGAWAEDRRGPVPEVVAAAWSYFRDRADIPLERLAAGQEPQLCRALLTLHAVADEACAGLGVALDSSDGIGCVYRARGRELLARTGSLARVGTRFLRVFPKVSTPPTGRASFSRYATVHSPCMDIRWHKMPVRHRGTDLRSEYATMLLLPWPLQVRATDFRPLKESLHREAQDPYGLFEFAPAERLDLDLLDRVLAAARLEAGSVDVVVLPESAVEDSEINDLEKVLDAHGVAYVQAGVREPIRQPGKLPDNWVHIGVNSGLEKGGGPRPSEEYLPWFRLRQNKHHRWMLDESQVEQYHLGGVLHPHIRWWEAMDVPRKAIHFVEVAELVVVALVCQDLAENDDIAQLIRSVGPTCVVTVLLDGPQLTSRWSARYASVLADDPGSAVLTLAPLGMVERSRPHNRDASRVIALWKDPTRGVHEIAVEPGADAVLLTVCMDRATRFSSDRRWPADNGTSCYDVALYQVRAAAAGAGKPSAPATPAAEPVLDAHQLHVLTCWAEGVSEAAAYAPEQIDGLLAQAGAGSGWRAEFGLPELAPRLADAMEALGRGVRAVATSPGMPLFDALLTAASEDRAGEERLDRVVRHALLSMLEERRTRERTRERTYRPIPMSGHRPRTTGAGFTPD